MDQHIIASVKTEKGNTVTIARTSNDAEVATSYEVGTDGSYRIFDVADTRGETWALVCRAFVKACQEN